MPYTRTLAASAPSPAQMRLALLASLLMAGIVAATWPVADMVGPRLYSALSAYQAVVIFADLVTALLLATQFRQMGALGFLALACGYLFTGLAAIFHLAAFPGVFAEHGVLGGRQTASYLWIMWHGGFPVIASLYVWLARAGTVVAEKRRRTWVAAGAGVAVMLVLVGVAVVTWGHDSLPKLIDGESFAPQQGALAILAVIGTLATLGLLRRARRSVVELWLTVATLAFTLEMLSNMHVGSRFDLGWYLGRGYNLVASTLVLAVYLVELSYLLRQQGALLQQATAASAAKSRFFAAASHDLRQPFQAMRLFYTVLEGNVSEAQRLPFERLGLAMASAESLLSELLDVARLERGEVSVTRESVDVGALLSDLGLELAAVARQKGLDLRVRPLAANTVTDPLLLKRILFNLVTNAIRYTEEGGVVVGARRRAGRVMIEIWDTGRGISEQDRERIFEEFYQVGNPGRDRAQGLGLGLSIVKRLASLLGCEVSMASRLGRGTVFRVALAA